MPTLQRHPALYKENSNAIKMGSVPVKPTLGLALLAHALTLLLTMNSSGNNPGLQS